MEKMIRKMIVRLDVVEVDKLMSYSKTKIPPDTKFRLVGKSDLWKKMWRS